MNPRRVHELMRRGFPPVRHETRDWIVVQRPDGADRAAIATLLHEHIGAPELLLQVHRKEGALLPVMEAVEYIAAHLGQGEIHVADLDFRSFVVVAQNGVAAGWRTAAD